MIENPYKSAKDYQMWRRAVSRVEAHRIDPVVDPKFKISAEMRVGTAGSCFAQHISKQISKIGFNYFVPEDGCDLPEDVRTRRNYGVFSARYGNIYTVAQLLQLFEEAFDGRTLFETAWQRPDGQYVDPYRPQIDQDGFDSIQGVDHSRKEHLNYVKELFCKSELFIFTLGLTEAWRSKKDGAVFPLAPGVVASTFDPDVHEYHNYSASEVEETLIKFLARLKKVNPNVKVLLTVSPVPLIATYENRHVLVSTTYSKSVLRVAAQGAVDEFDWVDYFPSYEIITGSSTGGIYFEDDHREVNSKGVAHAMRCFVNNYVSGKEASSAPTTLNPSVVASFESAGDIICDEEALDTELSR
ncbi:GSCFA domain-containing protein [Paracoccus sp. Z330]|uniref:GSCFA domain-containing protein n=1 Tax=Paracoccus onchidii TaxID=3017813 RepID=A0ABT4ZKV5_9RHOB|nr:GSCFA domain-containing protein [Paracoccus onchidii]MDB6179717.1 GSCFA domain-containing protein [Paracoccus onchidii]